MAQLAAQDTLNVKAEGSSPSGGSLKGNIMSFFCVQCCKVMRCEKNGVQIGAWTPVQNNDSVHGYSGDMYKCPECGYQIVIFNIDGGGHQIQFPDFVIKD